MMIDEDLLDGNKTPIDPLQFRKVASLLATGVAVVTSEGADGKLCGLTMTSVTSLSLDPPLFLICVDRKSETLPAIVESGRFCINLLSTDQKEIATTFSGKKLDKFAMAHHRKRKSGQVEIPGAIAVIECEVDQTFLGGDHTIIIGRPRGVSGCEGMPLVYFRGSYHEVRNLPPTFPKAIRSGRNDASTNAVNGEIGSTLEQRPQMMVLERQPSRNPG